MKALFTIFVLTVALASVASAQNILISEYIEGSSNNKAVELVNISGADLDMSRVTIERYNNGGTEAGFTGTLEGTLGTNDVYIIANSQADQAILDVANDVANSSFTWYNGDDVLLVLVDGVVEDSIGKLGEDPGNFWGTEPCTTQEHTLVRKVDICIGDTVIDDDFDPSLEWDCYDQNDFSHLGTHTFCGTVAVDYNSWGSVKSLYR